MPQAVSCSRSLSLILFISLGVGCDRTEIIYPERKTLIEAVYASGKMIPDDEALISSLSNGVIIQKLVKDGASVEKGQLIYVVRNEAAKERYSAALKTYEIANDNLSAASPVLNDALLALQNAASQCTNDSSLYARYKILWQENIGTQNNLDNVRLKYEASLNQRRMAEQRYTATLNDLRLSRSTAKSQLAAADDELKDHFIRSDRAGIIYQTFKEVGETVSFNETVALIGRSNGHLIRMMVDQQDIARIRKGQKVLIQSDISGSGVYEALVSHIYPAMNELDQTFRVDATFVGEPPPTFIHSSIEANIIIRQKELALVIPRTVLMAGDSIWINGKEGREKRKIKTGISTLEYIEVLSGLSEQTPVILTGQNTGS